MTATDMTDAKLAELGPPRNATTGEQYQGGNVVRLTASVLENGYGSNEWAGFHQWIKAGRVVRKGEHGTACMTVVSVTDDKGKAKKKPRGFRVFNVAQTVELETVAS